MSKVTVNLSSELNQKLKKDFSAKNLGCRKIYIFSGVCLELRIKPSLPYLIYCVTPPRNLIYIKLMLSMVDQFLQSLKQRIFKTGICLCVYLF